MSLVKWLESWLNSTDTLLRNEFNEQVGVVVVEPSAAVVTTTSLINLRTLYSNIVITATEALEHIIYACLVYLLVCLGIYKLTFLSMDNNNKVLKTTTTKTKNNNTTPKDNNTNISEELNETTNNVELINNGIWRYLKFINHERLPKEHDFRRVLFVISHPDDECMFFGPLIYTLTRRTDCNVYLLCMSNGNYEKKGDSRRDELWKSCEQLGISASNIFLINATNLPDDPNVEWKTQAVANLILNKIESLDIQAIFTFDRDGVSQHPNHCSLYFATASLCLANLLPKDCKFYTLDTINILRKYISIFDLLCTCIMSSNWCILSWRQANIVRQAMREHKSQMKWFRWLYIYFSRYMFINSMREVNLSDIELEMQIHDN